MLLCAPFIKAGVAKRLLSVITPGIPVEIYTRWHVEEVAAGVSDLAVFDFVGERAGTTLKLLDSLHAKLYFSDDRVLVGSANLTATALGWCTEPNVELLVEVGAEQEAVIHCRAALAGARLATFEERAAIQALVDTLHRVPLPGAMSMDEELAVMWLPHLAAPDKLFMAYKPEVRGRLSAPVMEAADLDLMALAIEPHLDQVQFNTQVAERFSCMPAIRTILSAAARDLSDEEGIAIISSLHRSLQMNPEDRWKIVREWIVHFLPHWYEIVPQSFITRLRPGARRE